MMGTSPPMAASSKLEECNEDSTPGGSASAGQQVSKYARIRGLPTPRSSLNISDNSQHMSDENDERRQQDAGASSSNSWAGAAVLPLRKGVSKQHAGQ